MPVFGKPLSQLPELGSRPRRKPAELTAPRDAKLTVPKSLNYERIKREVMAAIGRLAGDKQAQIPAAGTLPEQMVAYALVMLSYSFECQNAQSGGRLRLGGSIVDFIVAIGGAKSVIRVQGDYWHSLPERKAKDAVQLLRLQAKGYRVVDLWEHDVYQAWIENRLVQWVEQELQAA